jgi:hypothetical protein
MLQDGHEEVLSLGFFCSWAGGRKEAGAFRNFVDTGLKAARRTFLSLSSSLCKRRMESDHG